MSAGDVAWRALGFSSWPYSGPPMAREGAPASGLAKPPVENVIATVVLAAQGLPGRLRRQAHVLLAWAPGPRPRSRVPLLSRSCSPAPGSPTAWRVSISPPELAGLHPASCARRHTCRPHRVGRSDFLRDSGKRYAVIPDEVEQAVSEHAGLCIDMRADEILISA